MRHTLHSPAGRLDIETDPLTLHLTRDGRPALTTGHPALWVRAYGLDIPLLVQTTSLSAGALADPDLPGAQGDGAAREAGPIPGGEITCRLGIPGRPETATLRVAATPGGFRLTATAPPGASAVGLNVRADPGRPWYGGGERVVQEWPLDRGAVSGEPFIPYDCAEDGTLNIATPLWFGAGWPAEAGAPGPAAGILAAANGELSMTLDRGGDGLLRLLSRPPVPGTVPGSDGVPTRVGPELVVDFLLAANIPAVFGAALAEIGHPSAVPPAPLFTQPIWTTWARYKMGIDQTATLAFAAGIVEHGFGRSVLEIDDRWQATYGELRFDPVKFPDPAAMIATLHGQGFAVTLWVPPFFSPDSPAFAEAARHGFLVRHPAGGAPYLVRWWQGYGGLLDVSHPAALDWWRAGLRALQTAYGVDGFKFDAGEGNFLPADAVTHAPLRRCDYADRYVAFVGAHMPLSEVRAGYRAQRTPVLFRQWDKWSRWGRDNGLHACLTQALALSLAGYPFILPDMIGGNAYEGEVPDRELLIRWTQMNALLPAMQFSLPPWEYDAETTAICRRYTELHSALAPYILHLAAGAAAGGTPIIRPLFWHAPAERPAYFVDDAFLLGDRYLAAPVVQPGVVARDIYLPAGRWRDYWTGKEHGGGVLTAYPAPLDVLPLFERVAG